METEQVPDDQAHKKGRHRKKQLYNSILQLMEFYFSDSNLTKDRFLSQLINSDPYVDIAVFLKFNKLRKLTTNLEDVTKAISKSELIELSEDKTKVRRKAPIKVKENVDECTIYVERLKSDATHDWLTSIFSEFGNVVYVSIPKYKHNGMIKGFAFVEFEHEEGAKAALQYFESIGCKIPSCMEPQKLCSIATYEGKEKNTPANKNEGKENTDAQIYENEESPNDSELMKKELKKRRRTDDKEEDAETRKTEKQNGTQVDEAVAIKKKRKHDSSEVSECAQHKMSQGDVENKKIKTEKRTETAEGAQPETLPKSESKMKKRRKHSETEINEGMQQEKSDDSEKKKEKILNKTKTSEDTQQEPMSEGEGEEKKKKKHKKSHRKKVNLKEIGLQILSKKEWKKMRNRYLDMQKKTMKQLKMHLNRQRFTNRYESRKSNERHFEMEIVQENNKEKPLSQFIPGTIVKVSLSEPCEDSKKLKTEIKACSSEIKYVDIPQQVGTEEIYVRFSDNKNAQEFCTSNFDKGKASLLEGNEEKKYWEKIEAAKQAKQKRSGGKQRGRDKLLKKAERQVAKHVRFDDNDSE